MSLTLTVAFPRPISVRMGTIVEIIGVFTAPDHVAAYQIIDAQGGINYSATPEEFNNIKRYDRPVLHDGPLIGEIVGCLQRDKSTFLTFFPTSHSPYDYNQMAGSWVRSAVPAYWKLTEEKNAWERRVTPLAWSRFNENKYRPALLDVKSVAEALYTAYEKRENYHHQRCMTALWNSADKLRQVERHLERLKIINSLRVHLYAAMKSDAREFHLSETREEAVLTVEAGITTIFSALDILAHAINELYNLSLTPHQVGFFNVVFIRSERTDVAEAKVARCLEKDFPADPLTALFLLHRDRWIQAMSEWRHFIVHHGCLDNGEFVGGGVLIEKPTGSDVPLTSHTPSVLAADLLENWTAQLRELLEEAFQLITADAWKVAEEQGKQVTTEEPLEPMPAPTQLSPVDLVTSFLEWWKRSDTEEPKRIDYMYSRLAGTWRKEWKLPQFREFVTQHPLKGFSLVGTVSSISDERFGRLDRMSAKLEFAQDSMVLGFAVIPVNKRRYGLIRLPFSTVHPFETLLQIIGYQSRQSGRETGHRDMVFSATVRNCSTKSLEEVTAHIFWHQSSEANVVIGTLLPGEERLFECSWKDACVPPSREYPPLWIDRGTFRLRLVYRLPTNEGDWWAEDHGTA